MAVSRYFRFAASLLILLFSVSSVSAFSSDDDVFRVRDRKMVPFDKMLEELEEADIILIGETHHKKEHHDLQLRIIRALYDKKVDLSIGLEMFLSSDQDQLDRWVRGYADREEFIRVYYRNWDIPWINYRDIFLFSRKERIPMVGLNVPRKITSKISREGCGSLTDDDLYQLPKGISCDIDKRYKEHIRRVYETHDKGEKEFDFFCEAQVVWDKAMALNLLQYLREERSRKVVVLSGTGHSWKRGIPSHIKKGSDHSYKVVLPETPEGINRENVLTNDADYLLPVK
jgi:uncharacterized iron-regulated protein